MKTITIRLEGHVEVFLLEKTDVLDAERTCDASTPP